MQIEQNANIGHFLCDISIYVKLLDYNSDFTSETSVSQPNLAIDDRSKIIYHLLLLEALVFAPTTADFQDIRKNNYFYIDKTRYIYHIAHKGGKVVFLTRPRRFGKSLLVN